MRGSEKKKKEKCQVCCRIDGGEKRKQEIQRRVNVTKKKKKEEERLKPERWGLVMLALCNMPTVLLPLIPSHCRSNGFTVHVCQLSLLPFFTSWMSTLGQLSWCVYVCVRHQTMHLKQKCQSSIFYLFSLNKNKSLPGKTMCDGCCRASKGMMD